MKKFYVFLSFIIVGFILFINTVSKTVNIFTDITAASSEPFALLLFGSVLIGLANIGRKKVFKKKTDMAQFDMQPAADRLKENDRLEGWYAGKHVSEGLKNQ